MTPSKEEDNGTVLTCRVIEFESERVLLSYASAQTTPVPSDAKIRYLCVTAAKKVKIHKLKDKNALSASFNMAKSWGLDEINSIEPLKGNGTNIQLGGKNYYWLFDDFHSKIELMHTMVSLSQKYLNKVPHLIKIDEELLKDQMQICLAAKNQDKPAAVKPSENSTEPESSTRIEERSTNTAQQLTSGKKTPIHASTETVIPPLPATVQTFNNDLEAFLQKEMMGQKKRPNFESQQFNMDELLGGFNWQVNGDAADLEKKLETELQALEAANVHAIIESEDQAQNVLYQIDMTLNELNVVDEWLCHYTTLLDKMGQDVHSVEVRNKALQVTAANQKALLLEIDKIVASMKLSEPVSERLKYESLDDSAGIKNCERVVRVLMDTITRIKKDEEISDIGMVRERISLYESYSTMFSARLSEFMLGLTSSLAETLAKEKSRSHKISLRINGLDNIQKKLCDYRSLMRWLKSVDIRKHKEVEMVSVSTAASNALSVMSSNMIEKGKGGWNMLNVSASTKKKMSTVDDGHGEDSDRASKSKSENIEDEKIWPDEAVAEIYKALCPIIVRELNFVMDFFSIRKLDTELTDFSYEWMEGLQVPREKLKELKAQKIIDEFYDAMFDIHSDVCAFLEWCLKHDATFAIGMMCSLEACLDTFGNSAYMNFVIHLELLMTKLVLHFDKFIDEQIKAIEETKVTFRKRTGILPFIRTFPKFVDRMERCVSSTTDHTALPSPSTTISPASVVPAGFAGAPIGTAQARTAVSNAYARIVKCIFETVDALAKDQNDGKDSAKPEDKESLNLHILVIENMHHFHSEVRARKIASLDQYVKASKVMYDTNTEEYINIVIRKPLGKLLEFFENVENLLKSNTPEEVSFHLHKVTLRDILKKYPGKEVKRGLEALYKRVEKNFSSDEDGSLLQVVWRGIQETYTRNLKRYEELIALCYPDTGLKIEFTIDDLLGYFSDLAQNH
ncbi:hypothetical protein HDU82_005866 [Entophlyctis luteolus]|nr:hypothetical protein HDU82_005866 [Entophlyctis luteolus]